MKSIISIIACSFLVSCVSQFETMGDGGPKGRYYTYHYGQVGGKGTAQSSMGTAVAFDGEKSLADVLQAAVAKWGFEASTATNASNNAVKMHREGQITTRQLAELKSKVALAESAGEVQVALKSLGL